MKNAIYLALLACTFAITSCGEKKEEKASAEDLKNIPLASEKDPVCEMSVKGKAVDTILYQGKVYGFCNTGCKDEFKKDPGHYVVSE